MTEYSDKYIELIARYHANSLSESEREEVKVLLVENSEFAELNHLWVMGQRGIHAYGNQQLKSELVNGYTTPASGILLSWPLWGGLAVAAVIALLFLFSGSKDSSELFQEYYTTPTFGMRGGESEDRLSAQALYHDDRFEEAIVAYESIITNSDTSLTAREMIQLAISYAETQQLPKAISTLELISVSNPYIQQARWYSGLFYLEMDQVEKAKSIFSIVATESKDYGEAARNILDELL